MTPTLVQHLAPVRLSIPLADLIPNTWNPNKMPARQYEALKESIRDHGDIDPITARPHPDQPGKWQIIDGEHRHKALGEEGHSEAICEVVDAPTPQAKKLTIILNETRGRADRVELAGLLVDLQAQFGEALASGLPYTPSELEEQLALGQVDWGQYPTTPPDTAQAGAGEGTATTAGNPTATHSGDTIFAPFSAYLTTDQFAIVLQALDRARLEAEDGGMGDARALELVCADYLAS